MSDELFAELTDQTYDDPGTPLFWELMVKYGPAFLNSPWAPEFVEAPEVLERDNWPVTFDGALAYTKRLVAAQTDTQYMPILALDQYAQQVDLDSTAVQEVLQGVLVDD